MYPEKSVEIRAKLRSRVSKPRKYRGRNRKLANLFRPPRVSKKFIASTEDRASLADPPNVPRLSIHYRNTTATLRTNEQNSLTDHRFLSAYSPRDSSWVPIVSPIFVYRRYSFSLRQNHTLLKRSSISLQRVAIKNDTFSTPGKMLKCIDSKK